MGQLGDGTTSEVAALMGLVWIRARAELRSSWRSTMALILVLGIGGGVVLTAFAGARRTDSAMQQFVNFSEPDDGAFLFGNVNNPPVAPGMPARSLELLPGEQRVVDLPQVAEHFQMPYLYLTSSRSGFSGASLNAIGASDSSLFRSVDRPMVVAGHLPNPRHPYDVAINELAGKFHHLHIGSSVRLYSYSLAQSGNGRLTSTIETDRPMPAGPTFKVRVVAVVRFPQDVNAAPQLASAQDVSYEGQQNLYLTPAFLQRLAERLGISVHQIPNINFVGVRLRHGAADWNSFAAEATAAGAGQVFASPGNVFDIRSSAASAQRGIHLEVVALVIFGAIAALVTLLLLGQALARMAALERGEYSVLRTLGASKGQLMAVVLARAALIGAAGGALAVTLAILLSPLMPIGPARQAEIHLGISIDPLVLALGWLLLASLSVACAVLPARRASRMQLPSERTVGSDIQPSTVAATVARSPLPLVAGMGIRFGLDPGHGRKAVPIVGTIVSTALAVGAVTAALTFGSSLEQLIASPRQQGWNWDVLVGNPNSTQDQEARTGRILSHDRYVAAYSAIAILAGAGQGNVVIDGRTVDSLLAFDPLKGSVYPPLLDGHPPRQPNQVVFGTKTLQALHRRVGQSVQVSGPGGKIITVHIVGSMISPSVGDLFTNSIGEGGWISGSVVRQQEAQGSTSPSEAPPLVFTLFAVRYAPGVSKSAALVGLQRDFGDTVLRQIPSQDVINLQSVDRLPALLAGLVALLGVATVGNTLVTSVRRRRSDLAVLKSLGFVRRQTMAVVAWQATSFSVIALLIGMPLGIACGRWAWTIVSSGIGSSSPPSVPAGAVAIIVPVTLLLANLIAAWPGYAATRIAPALEMRSE